MNPRDLTPEQAEKAKAFETPEEILAFARENGVELSDEQLDKISGGEEWEEGETCPKCGSTRTSRVAYPDPDRYCLDCSFRWVGSD